MASRARYAVGSHVATTNVQEQRQATLRLRVEGMQQEMTTKFEREVQNAKREMEAFDSDEEMSAYVDGKFDMLNSEFTRHSDALRQQVKSKMPKKPKREDYSSAEDYDAAKVQHEADLADYKSFLEFSVAILKRLTNFISNLFTKIREFFSSLWQWIKSKFEAIAKKVKEFVQFMKDQFSGLVSFIFG